MKTIVAAIVTTIFAVTAKAEVDSILYDRINSQISMEIQGQDLSRAVALSEIYRNLRQADAAEALTKESRFRMAWLAKMDKVIQCLPALIKAAQETACPEGKNPSPDNYASRNGTYQMLSVLRRVYTFLNDPDEGYGVKAVKDSVEEFKKLDDANMAAWKNRNK